MNVTKGIGLTEQQERFCAEVAAGNSFARSYEVAGYKPDRTNAWKLARKPHIATRIAELTGKIERMTESALAKAMHLRQVTAETITIELEEARSKAMNAQTNVDAQGAQAVIAASISKAKLLGLWRERHEETVNQVQYFISDRDITTEEWRREHCGDEGLTGEFSG